MNELFRLFHKQVKERISKYIRFYSFGEDSIRYDFYHTALNFYNLKPTDLILEQAIPQTQFTEKKRDKKNQKQGRHKDKPEYDLRIDANSSLKNGILAEFAFFRQTEISNSQDRTARHGKLLNEIHRLALLKHFNNQDNNPIYKDFTNYKCLLICVTDSEMINYGRNERGRKAEPIQKEYQLSEEYLADFPDTIRKAIDEKFSKQIKKFNIIPTAKLIFEQNEIANNETPNWVTWIWEVDFKNKKTTANTVYN
ncbi:hypothetical protein [Winogradskyella damuponensis]